MSQNEKWHNNIFILFYFSKIVGPYIPNKGDSVAITIKKVVENIKPSHTNQIGIKDINSTLLPHQLLSLIVIRQHIFE